VSFGVTMYTLWIAYSRGRQMLEFGEPSTTSLIKNLEYEQIGKVHYNQLALQFLEIKRGEDVALDLEAMNYKQFFHLRYKHVIVEFDANGKSKTTTNFYGMERCTERNYEKSKYAQNYYKEYASSRY
jgi:hypothetical protein